MPKISRHSYDIAVAVVRRDHTSGVSVLYNINLALSKVVQYLSLLNIFHSFFQDVYSIKPYQGQQKIRLINCGS